VSECRQLRKAARRARLALGCAHTAANIPPRRRQRTDVDDGAEAAEDSLRGGQGVGGARE
jgi:hypothetical protein